MQKRKNKFYFLVIFLLIFSFFLLLVTFYLNSSIVLEKKELELVLKTGKVSAFNLDPPELNFGTISVGSSSERTLDLENNYNFPVQVEFYVSGSIKKFLIFDKIVYLEPNEVKSVKVKTITLIEEDFEEYFGKMIVLFKKRLLQ